MSAIYGRFQRNGINVNAADEIGRWNSAYGENGNEIWENDYFFAGCYLEKLTTDKTYEKVLPKDKMIVGAMDSLIYNSEELRESVANRETLVSDEDLLFHFYLQNGVEQLKSVNGDFAGAIYDEERKCLTLFRDHMGVRPLYYYATSDCVAFSTDIRGLLGMNDYVPQINELWLYKTISGFSTLYVEDTPFENIHCVPPGGYVRFDLSVDSIIASKGLYWQIGQKKIRFKKDSEYISTLRSLIEDSVRRRLSVCSDPIGAELSGGLDSGVIDILINRMGHKAEYFSWSASPDLVPYADGDERLIVRDICEQEGISCNYSALRVEIGEETRTAKMLKSLGAYDDADGSNALMYAVPPFANTLQLIQGSEFVRSKGARVMFTGHGGDEGVSHRSRSYEMFYNKEYYHYLRYMWSKTHGSKGRVIKTLKSCFKDVLENTRDKKKPFVFALGTKEIFNNSFSGKFDDDKMPPCTFLYDSIAYIKSGGSQNRLDNVAFQGGYAGVRYLIPFLDYRVVDYAVSIPRYMYLRGRTNRYIYREAFKDILPTSLYRQRIKRDTSYENVPGNPNWYEKYRKGKEYVYTHLNHEMWEKYLDFDIIDKWYEQGKPLTDEERDKAENIYGSLYLCMIIQNVIEKSKLQK